ncbi:hypothetical protein ACAH01_12425 [Halomicrobium sp. HM KBTZ05]|uniref:hypothetical protein n=1 Tax=Halomicrobium sp. HM KBTZ05 TaxID=3242663 RepID=UPI0035564660
MASSAGDGVEDRLLRVCEQLQIPKETLQITQVRLGQLRNKPEIDDENIDDFLAAALVLSAREDGLPVDEDTVASAWSELLDDREITITEQQLDTASVYLDVDEVPPKPQALADRLGLAVEMPDSLVDVAHRILLDAFELNPEVIANGRSPGATAGGALSLAALVNGHDAEDVQNVLSGASKTSRVAIENRAEALKRLLGDRLQDERYQMNAETEGEVAQPVETATATDGAGEAEEQSASEPDEVGEPETPSGPTGGDTDDETPATPTPEDTDSESETPETEAEPEVTVQAVEDEIDALVEELGVDAPTRLLARGMVGDAVGEVDVSNATELAGATLVAGLRLNEADTDAGDVAARRPVEARAVVQTLGALDEAIDADIPSPSPEEIVADLVAELDLSDAVAEESRRTLERYAADEPDSDYTAAELAAGSVVFAATVNGTQVDVERLGAISGATPAFVTDAMNDIVVSLCLGLVAGEIDYEECSWTTDLLESELSPDLGDSRTGRAIAVAKTYTAGREGRHVDDATLDAVLGTE